MPRVMPRPFPAAHHIEALLHFFEKTRDLFRVILKVGIHSENELAAHFFPTRRQGVSFAHVPAETDGFNVLYIVRCKLSDRPPTFIDCSLIDENNLPTLC